jgi:hypothetical protein
MNQYTPTPVAENATIPHITTIIIICIHLVFFCCLVPAADKAVAFLFLFLAHICGSFIDKN